MSQQIDLGLTPACTRPGQVIWAKVFNDPKSIQAGFLASVASDEGSLYVAGAFSGTIDFGGGPLTASGEQDAVVARFTHDGTHVWSRQIGGSGSDVATVVSVDANGQVCVGGVFTGTADFGGQTRTSSGRDMFLACYGPDQSLRWIKSFAGYLSPQRLSADQSGDITVAGNLRSDVDLGGGLLNKTDVNSDVLLARFTSGGEYVYAKYFGAQKRDDSIGGLALGPDGSAFLTGFVQGSTDFGAGALTPTGEIDVYLAQYAPSGALRFAKLYGGPKGDMGNAIVIDEHRRVFTAGGFNGTVSLGGTPLTSGSNGDSYLAQYDLSGAHVFSIAQGWTYDDLPGDIVIDGQGELVLAGQFAGRLPLAGGELTSAGGQDIFLAVHSPDGAPLRASRFGGSDDDTLSVMARSGPCNVAIAGNLRFKNNTGATVSAATLSVVQP